MEKKISTDTKRLYGFVVLCHNHCISPEIAIENESIKSILEDNKDTYYKLIEEILINEF